MRLRLGTYWEEHNLGRPLNTSMLLLTTLGLVLAFGSSGLAQDLGLNIAFTAVGVILTVYFVDAAVKRREEKRWSGVDEVAHRSLRRAATQFLESIALNFDPLNIDRFVVTGFEMRVSPELVHLKHARDPDWRVYIRSEIAPRTKGIRYEQFEGNNQSLIQALQSYDSSLGKLWPLMSRRWSPEQTAQVMELVFQLPVEAELL